jgi:hypothetical protein
MSGKAFCSVCVFFKEHGCDHESNLVDDWYAEKHAQKQYCSVINEQNNCKNYQRIDLKEFRRRVRAKVKGEMI